MVKKLQSIDYTSRDYSSIRRDLENFARRYYPNTYQDFNEASFGSLMIDTVAYIGDILSFYLDYQANESFLDSAIEYNNVIRLARQFGFKLNTSPSSFGALTCYISVPANSTATGPDLDYTPVLKGGSQFKSTGGGMYTLLDDVDFKKENNQMVVGEVDGTTNLPSTYVIRGIGRAISGRVGREQINIGAFQRFLRVPIAQSRINNIISVKDTEGNVYYEVDNLSQNIIFKALRNTSATRATVPNILKAVPVVRRFVTEYDGASTYLQFGYGSGTELISDAINDPANIILDLSGRDYITDTGFDPTKLISTDKFGVAPADTKLTITYRYNTVDDVNAAVNTIVSVTSPKFKFESQGELSPTQRITVVNSLEVANEEPFVGDISLPSAEEIKQRVFSHFSTQHRAVTPQDYKSVTYAMPAKFGAIKRANVVRDFDAFKRNVNLYVISQNSSGKLTVPNNTLKINLKSWLSQYKMVNDTIDILDATIVNYKINYEVLIDLNANRFTVLSNATAALKKYASQVPDIGEPIRITDIYKTLQGVAGVVDVIDVLVQEKSGPAYSSSNYDFKAALSADGREILGEPNIIFELKFPNVDIKGSIK